MLSPSPSFSLNLTLSIYLCICLSIFISSSLSSFPLIHIGGATLLGRAMDSRLVHNPVSPDLHLTNSPAHDAFQLFASRLLRPIWQRAIAAPSTKKVRKYWRKHFYISIFNSVQNIIPKRRIKIES